MTDNENALIAYAILDEVNEMVTNGGDPAVVTREIARAQVYATLATATRPEKPAPDQNALGQAIREALDRRGVELSWSDVFVAAEAVEAIL